MVAISPATRSQRLLTDAAFRFDERLALNRSQRGEFYTPLRFPALFSYLIYLLTIFSGGTLANRMADAERS